MAYYKLLQAEAGEPELLAEFLEANCCSDNRAHILRNQRIEDAGVLLFCLHDEVVLK